MSRLSVQVRATIAATAIVAVALGAAAAVLVGVLGGSLTDTASAEATRRADLTADMLSSGTLIEENRFGRPADPDIEIIKEEQAAFFAGGVAVVERAGEPYATEPRVARRVLPASGAGGEPDDEPGTDRKPGAGGRTGVASDAEGRTGDEPGGKGRPAVVPGDLVSAEKWAPPGAYVTATLPVDTSAGPLLVKARASLDSAHAALATLKSVLLPGIPALLLLVAVLTWLVVGRALAPVSAIRAEVADITASDLHRRVPVPRSRDEIARLAETMNRTLDRLELAVSRHKRFVADAAHEFRSPLAILRTRLELAPPGPLSAEALTDVDRIQALTSDLLLLARLDAGEPDRHEEVDLGQVAAEEAARSRPRSEVRVGLEVAADVVVRGSAGQLRRLVANLVDNAVRHAESAVTVRLGVDGREAVLEVCDDGPGIPAEHHEAVFDRFTRLDEARDRDAGGSGLGLAIARDIAVRHGGGLAVVAGPPGACLRARFPVASATDRRLRDVRDDRPAPPAGESLPAPSRDRQPVPAGQVSA
ncbi:sensor histidine kinase [Planobispora siamensis]|uniref:histidine kinase n=1 Tax=Planobispora siamensis TaxID=936338 RepID=A0A8J3SJZ7_9ACTN|nr:HAMP domain-containing sensor histidine kinase [Planobispora siamensis]GIH93805.1 two-component sensor histidine kinase [Planobispora siamensis]